MDKVGWQIFLGLQMSGLLIGLSAALLPPWNFHENVAAFVRGAEYSFFATACLLIIYGVFSGLHTFWAKLKKEESESPMFKAGPERVLLIVYVSTLALMFYSSRWFLLPGFAVTLILLLLIIAGYLVEERKANESH